MRELDIVPVIDLCHFGVPDWIGDFQNPEFSFLFAEYARAFATRYPWIRFCTPVNEMSIAAEFSAFYRWWNEQLRSHKGFVCMTFAAGAFFLLFGVFYLLSLIYPDLV